ncbi:hypothetical protein OE88DRAFT_1176769 [Heliocybe sulcata]|uniref:Uncharacterized protein n=1 Tax=Heliocybe sulcata TaxID=5364 RepID=A0A5C3NAB1_9AGAM|nr:hypothetical protein OE88DRAFT_1176769 [Heliocybe sulcata]
MAEATRLWHYSGRGLDRGGREAACEAAAATAQVIHDRQNLDDVGPGPLRRRSSYASFHSADPYDQDYGYDGYEPAYSDGGFSQSDPYGPPRRRYSSSSSRPPPIPYAGSSNSVGFPPMGSPAPVPIQSTRSYSVNRRPSFNAGYSGGIIPMPAAPSAPSYGAVSPPTYSTTPYGSPMLGSTAYGSPVPGGFMPPPVQQQQPYTVYSGSSAYQVPAGSTIILQGRSRKHSHRHRRHSSVKY